MKQMKDSKVMVKFLNEAMGIKEKSGMKPRLTFGVRSRKNWVKVMKKAPDFVKAYFPMALDCGSDKTGGFVGEDFVSLNDETTNVKSIQKVLAWLESNGYYMWNIAMSNESDEVAMYVAGPRPDGSSNIDKYFRSEIANVIETSNNGGFKSVETHPDWWYSRPNKDWTITMAKFKRSYDYVLGISPKKGVATTKEGAYLKKFVMPKKGVFSKKVVVGKKEVECLKPFVMPNKVVATKKVAPKVVVDDILAGMDK